MFSIVVASGKGGSGKTTLTAHLAVESNSPIVDTDKQATLAEWHGRRQADTPERLDLPLGRLGEGLGKVASHGADYCFIDTAPAITDQNAGILALADLILVPVRPSPADLWSVGQTIAMAKRAGKPFLFVLTQAKLNASITAQAIAALSEHGRVARSFIADRVAYAAAMTSGQTAPELWPKGPTVAEVGNLWNEVQSCFVKSCFVENNIRLVASNG
jgi:chromosome partitioning protein